MSEFAECRHCGTYFHLGKGARTIFECSNCQKVVKVPVMSKALVPFKSQKKAGKKSQQKKAKMDGEKFRQFQDRLTRLIFLMGSTVGIFVLLMMVPSLIYIENKGFLYFILLIELVFGTLLVCASVSFYLLSSQVLSLTALMNFHQHNLAIFHDQITKLFTMFKRRE